MTIRYCPRCKTDVEDTGGYCLLGHRLALEPPVASITDLRAEVDRAFEEARLEVASVMTADDAPTAPMTTVAPATTAAAPAPPTASPPPPVARPSRRVPPPPPPPRHPKPTRNVAPVQPSDGEPGSGHPTAASAPQTAPVSQPAGPAQPPSAPTNDLPTAQEIHERNASVWKDLDAEVDIVGDPIGAFAPPPHMDWGPNKGKVIKRKPSRRARRPESGE